MSAALDAKIAELKKKMPTEKVAQPDKEGTDASIAKLEAEIKVLQKQMENVEKDIVGKFDGTKNIRAKRDEARKALQVIRDEKKIIMDERKRLFDARDAFNSSLEKMKEDSKKMRNEIKFRSVEDIDKAIERLEYRQSTSSLSLSEEKQLLKEVSMLKANRRELHSFISSAPNPDGTKDALKNINEQINSHGPKLKEVSERLDAQAKVLKDLDDIMDAAHKDEVPVLKQKKVDLKAQVDRKFNEIREARSKLSKDLKVWREHSKKVEQVKYEIRKAEREERDKYYEEQRRIKEEEEEKLKPWLEEIATCDMLLSYLKTLLPKKSAAKENDETAAAPAAAVTLNGPKGEVLVAMKKKGEDDPYEVHGFKGKQKAAVKKEKKPVKTSLTHGFDTIADFKRLGLNAPLMVADLETAITELTAKRHYFDTKPREKKVKKVKTPYGAGTLISTREDGIKIIEMDWKLANDSKVMAYCQSKDVKYV